MKTLALIRAQAASILNSSQVRILRYTFPCIFMSENDFKYHHQPKCSSQLRKQKFSQMCLEKLVMLQGLNGIQPLWLISIKNTENLHRQESVVSKARMSSSVRMCCSCRAILIPCMITLFYSAEVVLHSYLLFSSGHVHSKHEGQYGAHFSKNVLSTFGATHSTLFSCWKISSAATRHQAMSFSLRNLQHPLSHNYPPEGLGRTVVKCLSMAMPEYSAWAEFCASRSAQQCHLHLN